MSFSLSQISNHLIGLTHSGSLNKIRNLYSMYERSASRFLLKVKPLESIRLGTLSNLIHDDVYNYSLPSDFLDIIDLIPQDNRSSWDTSVRNKAGKFDLEKATKNKTLSIEGSEGSKVIRINWRTRRGKTLHNMNSVTSNGTWSAVGSATAVQANTIFKISGSASIEFDLVATGDGIKNTTMSAVDLTDEDEVADIFVWVYLGATVTSISARWGNDLTTNYWASTAQTTQADGTAFKVGWNLLKFSWSTATETGTVAPATVDSFQITVASSAQNNIRIDNIIFSIGRNFDMKYYSKFLFKNSAGTYISQPTTDDDSVLLDNDTLPVFLMECLIDAAHQMEGSESVFDMTHAENQLKTLYPAYRAMFPSMEKKTIGSYGGSPFRNRL